MIGGVHLSVAEREKGRRVGLGGSWAGAREHGLSGEFGPCMEKRGQESWAGPTGEKSKRWM
jgi:hypothetical protein